MDKELINNEEIQEEQNEEVRTYTQEEVDKLLQSESDRRVTEALKKQERKLKEAEKLAQMNEAEKHQYELEQREKAIADKEIELQRAENKIEGLRILSEKNIDVALIDIILDDSAEVMNTRIKVLEESFNNAVKKEVERRMGSTTPANNQTNSTELTKEQFNKLSISKQQELYRQDPELYKQIIGR